MAPYAPGGAGRAWGSCDLATTAERPWGALGDEVREIGAGNARPWGVKVEELGTAMPLELPVTMREAIAAAVRRVGLRAMDLLSAAGHDARYLHGICPAGMIFVPCKGGIRHNEAESATPEDLYDGARVLAETLAELAG